MAEISQVLMLTMGPFTHLTTPQFGMLGMSLVLVLSPTLYSPIRFLFSPPFFLAPAMVYIVTDRSSSAFPRDSQLELLECWKKLAV